MSNNIISKDQLIEPYNIINEIQFKQLQEFTMYVKKINQEVANLDNLDFDPNFKHLLDFAKALSNDVRLKLLYFLKRINKTCFCELENVFNIKQSTLNYHVGLLKRANLIETYKEGKIIVLQLSDKFNQFLPPEQFKLFNKDE